MRFVTTPFYPSIPFYPSALHPRKIEKAGDFFSFF